MLGNGALRHAAAPRQLDHGNLVGPDDPLEHGAPRGIGKRAHDSVDGGGFNHAITLVHTNQLVNPNLSRLHSALIADLCNTPYPSAVAWLGAGDRVTRRYDGRPSRCQSSGSVKTAQGVAMPRRSCSPSGINLVFVSAATAPEISTLRPSGRHNPSSRLTRLTAGPIAVKSSRSAVPMLPHSTWSRWVMPARAAPTALSAASQAAEGDRSPMGKIASTPSPMNFSTSPPKA